MIYLDNAATTKPKKEVIEVITQALEEDWVNPSSKYKPSYDVKHKIDEARKIIADSINAEPNEIYFTSGGSEANCMALKSLINPYNHTWVATSEVEHKSILAHQNADERYEIHVMSDGMLDMNDLKTWLEARRIYGNEYDNVLVSVQYANNETGVIQNVKSISKLVHQYGYIFHTDAVQAYPHGKIDVKAFGIDMMSVSGHKFGAPKGIGFLYIKESVSQLIENSLIYGSQERGLRGGTENAPYILGLAKAVQLKSNADLIDKRRYFESELEKIGCKINCKDSIRLDSIISCMLPKGIVGETMMYYLSFNDIYVSTGSACNSSSERPSWVLQAIGLTEDEIRRTIRISISEETTIEDIDTTIKTMVHIMKERLR